MNDIDGLSLTDILDIKEVLQEPRFIPLEPAAADIGETPFALDLPEFMAGPREVEWLVEGLIPSTSLTVLAAQPKMGKSILTLNLAINLRLGASFIGRVVTRTKTLILQLEDPPVLIRERLLKMDAEGLDGIYIRAGAPMTKDDWKALPAFIKAHDIGLAIIDPYVFAMRGNEQDATQTATFLREIRELIFDTNCSILLVHHHKKSGGEHGQALRGSSALLGAVDVALELVREDEQTPTATLKVTSRFASVEDEVIVLDTESLTWKSAGSADTYKRTKRENEILSALEAEGDADIPTLAEVLDLDPKNFRRELRGLVAQGLIDERKEGTKGRPRYIYSLNPEYFSTPSYKANRAGAEKYKANRAGAEKFRASYQGTYPRIDLFGANSNLGVEKNAEKYSAKGHTCSRCGQPSEILYGFEPDLRCKDCRNIPEGVPF